MESRHVKTINTDSRSKKRIRFASSRERSKKASADVYRSYKRRIAGGVTSAATREQFVHNPRDQSRAKKRSKLNQTNQARGKDGNRGAFVELSAECVEDSSKKPDDDMDLDISTTFSSELDVTIDRNASEIFSKLHRELWILVRSLPEILHNLDRIVDLLMSYMLSPASSPETPTLASSSATRDSREEFVINHATTDVLHLLSVLARDLRHELHPYLHSKILPRIIQDLLNPPPPPPESNKQPIPLDVAVVETAFRTISYIFRYDSNLIVNDMESMRKYYGITLGHRRELVRRLSAETFAPQIRKIKSNTARERHIRRVLRALASTTTQPTTRALLRIQTDAVDGISNLLFQIVKGVPGKLHSQGDRILKFVLEYSCKADNSVDGEISKDDLVFNVATGLLKRLCYHFDKSGFGHVFKELTSLLSSAVNNHVHEVKENSSNSELSFHPIMKYMKMVVQIAENRSGKLLLGRSDDELLILDESISKLCSNACLPSLTKENLSSLMPLLCQTWITLQEKECISIEANIKAVLKWQCNNNESITTLLLILAKDLVHLLNDISKRNTVLALLISASAQLAKTDPLAALNVVFAVVSSIKLNTFDSESPEGRGFELFSSISRLGLGIDREEQEKLIGICSEKISNEMDEKALHASLCLRIRCAPFLVTLNGEIDAIDYNRIVEWLLQCCRILPTSDHSGSLVVKSLAIEAFAFLTLNASEPLIKKSEVKRRASKFKSLSKDLLVQSKRSIWATRGAASILPVLERLGLGPLAEDADDLFDALMPNLRSSSHFLRLYVLQIMASFPDKMFVVDHADLDLTDDLDEEEGYQPNKGEKKNINGPVGPCNLIKTLLKLENSPVRLQDERLIGSLIGKVEILARTRRLPAVYAEVAANHMLGIFNVKFSPLWISAEKTLLSLLLAHEEVIWPSFETKLIEVMKGDPTDVGRKSVVEETSTRLTLEQQHYQACRNWEDSNGKDVSLFEMTISFIEGEVPCYHTADAVTVMESVWRVAELGYRIVAKHSRMIVPLFIRFLNDQYFPFHSNDQDARELSLESFVTGETIEVPKIKGFVLQKRLKCFLSTFAAIEGPKQLVHHKLLEKIFRSFLGHPDPLIVEDSLSCLVKFKYDYLTPHQQHLREILQKGKLKSALINLSEFIENGKITDEDRKNLLPILARILFGRVTARTGKASSDSPASRRSAILSFLSVVCKEKDDFFPFLYMMTRSFIPRSTSLKLVELYNINDQSEILEALMRTECVDLALVPGPVVEGFLHLLHSVLSQLGHHVVAWVPALTSITIQLTKYVRVMNEASGKGAAEAATNDHNELATGNNLRRNAIRTLCFQRLSDIFELFGSSVDFSFVSDIFWFALNPSLKLLPEMVIRNEGCPAILTLLQTMSSDPQLVDLLIANEQSVRAVVKCISKTTRRSVIDASLTVIENLLSVTDDEGVVVGKELICGFAPVLLEQFTSRLDGRASIEVEDAEEKSFSSHKGTKSPTWRRELQILFKICELVTFDNMEMTTEDIEFIETLCRILLPFLEPSQGTLNDDKMNVLGILNGIVTKLEPHTTLLVFQKLSSFLGPHKSKAGIDDLSIRSAIAGLMKKCSTKLPDYERIAAVVVRLSSMDTKRIDEINFDVVIPELLFFSDYNRDDVGWNNLCTRSGGNPSSLVPVINVCFHFLHHQDGVISRASFNALRALIQTASSHVHQKKEGTGQWTKLLESSILPVTKSGLQSKDSKIRRHYILLVRDLSRLFSNISSANLCGDLGILCNEENEDLDFFLGITHVQIHRRARAFQRLRKCLSQICSGESKETIKSQSLSQILLPLALHPIYECKMRSEESFALDSIATLGAIARHLPWNKYNNVLFLVLSQFDRHPEQERYSVGALCAIIDGFNFELLRPNSEEVDVKTSVWTALENRIIPKIEGLLSKETTGKGGNREKTIRPALILALVKLFQKFPEEFFDSKLPSVLAVICDALRNRDSSARDIARNTMAKIVCSIDLKYLGDVVREVAITLNEGYKLHVRAATIHTILLQLLTIYEPCEQQGQKASAPFDECVPAIMDLIQDDLFGVANERRESTDTNVRFVKEAGGNKSVHSIEMLCRMITFAPSQARIDSQHRSAIHCIISPLLERLREPDIDAKKIRKVKEVLSRIAIGISNNKTLKGSELFPFVYATIHPYVGNDAIATVFDDSYDGSDDDDGDGIGIKISGDRRKQKSTQERLRKNIASVVEWRPSAKNVAQSGKSAMMKKKSDSRELRKVQDGASAPKLTGSSRHSLSETFDIRTINEPAAIAAIIFGLNLMNSCMKKLDIRDNQSLAMLDPFVPVLTACVCHCRDTEVALVALKCLLVLLRCELSSIASCSASLGSKTLMLLTANGSALSTNHDLSQACFKTLTHLIGTETKTAPRGGESRSLIGAENIFVGGTLPLNEEQMKVLLSLVKASITETDQHNPALNLIKVILMRRFTSPELYDLMESIMKLVVRSPKATLRQECAKLFVRYLLDYPMGEGRFEHQVKQVVANISYEYQEGRQSGILLLTMLVEKMPSQLLQKHAQHLFLPLVIQLVNDDSKECREQVSSCIILLFKRSSTEVLKILEDYCSRWSKQTGPLRMASLQVFGFLVDARADFIRSSSLSFSWVRYVENALNDRTESEWEASYFSLVCIEKLMKDFKSDLIEQVGLLSSVVECLIDPHPWIRLSSGRIVNGLFTSNLIEKLLSQKDGMLFDIVRNVVFQFNTSEEEHSKELSELGIRTLSLALPLMRKHPEYCYTDNKTENDNSDCEDDRDPVFWLMRRLSQIAKNKGSKRRMSIFKCYAAFSEVHFQVVEPHMELMLEGLHRSSTEARNEIENKSFSQNQSMQYASGSQNSGNESPMTENSLAEEVLALLEAKCSSSSAFLNAYAEVKRRAYNKKQRRKTEMKAEAVHNPQLAAERKIKKQERNKQRRKRRSEELSRERRGGEKRYRANRS